MAALGWFTLRRLVLLTAAVASVKEGPANGSELPTVTVVVPARNEAAVAVRLLRALDELDYPPELLSFVLVSDGSSDGTAAIFERWAEGKPHARVIDLPRSMGKAGALNTGLRAASGELIVVVDADLRPRSELVHRLARAFAEPDVGAAAAFLHPENADVNLISRYAALNHWVHQLITSAGKDQLRLNPPTFGASAYRRHALEEVGGFAPSSSAEDLEITIALSRAGWRTRFVAGAIADNDVVETFRHFWRQHIRWSRGTFGARRARRAPSLTGVGVSFETWATVAGSGDRVVFLTAAGLAAAGEVPYWVLPAYLVAPALSLIVALARAGRAGHLPRYAIAALALFPVDVAASLAAVVLHATRRPLGWHSSRAGLGPSRPRANR